MKQLTVLYSMALILMMSACSSTKTDSSSQSFKFDTTTVKSGDAFYQCPMHPAVISDKPGNCPECGMPLDKIIKH